jgi:NAD(P)H-dependent FMN reductase
MAFTPRILAFSGSLRQGSFNHRLATIAADAARDAGGDVELIRLTDFDMPIFNEDDEATSGMPAPARDFKERMIAAHGVIIASPEYNGSLSGALKNAIDWASRPESGETPLIAFRGKVCGLLSASPGGLGGIRGLLHLRPLLGNIQMHVLPDQFCLASANDKFNDDGSLKNDADRTKTEAIGRAVVDAATKLHG